jgi:hypothetical protein
MWKETKIALILSLIMNKKIHIGKKQIKILKKELTAIQEFETDPLLDKKFKDFLFEIFTKIETKRLKPNYKEIFELMDRFKNQTYYSFLLKEEVRERLRDRIRKIYESKSFPKNVGGLVLFDLFHFIAQSYFEDTNIQAPIEIFLNNILIRKAFPTFFIEFGKDFIEIGEKVGNNLVYKKYFLNSNRKQIRTKEVSTKNDVIPYKIVFPNAEIFTYKPMTKKNLSLAAILSKLLFYKKIYKD